jgi:hypothetical protein
MFDLVTAVDGGAGKLGVGVGVGALALTVMVRACLKTVPLESQACTIKLCLAADMAIEVSIFALAMAYALTLST